MSLQVLTTQFPLSRPNRTVANSESIIGHAARVFSGRVAAGALLHTAKKLAVHFRNVDRETGIDYERR